MDKPPISEAQKDWAQDHGPSPFHLPENQAQPWPAFLLALTPGTRHLRTWLLCLWDHQHHSGRGVLT